MNAKTKALNKINNEQDKKLNKENNLVMTDMVCYLRAANISEYNQETVRQDLLEMVLSAQERGEDIKTVIGEDYKTFCDEIIENLPKMSVRERIFSFIDIILLSASILMAINTVLSVETINIIRNLITGKPLNLNLSFTVGGLLSCCLVLVSAVLIVEAICKNAFKLDKFDRLNKFVRFVVIWLILVGIMAFFMLIAYFGRQTLFTLNIFIAAALAVFLYLAHKILNSVLKG